MLIESPVYFLTELQHSQEINKHKQKRGLDSHYPMCQQIVANLQK